MKIEIGCGTFLVALFATLKLCGVIAWSWWWVFSPFWLPIAIVVFIAMIALVFTAIITAADNAKRED